MKNALTLSVREAMRVQRYQRRDALVALRSRKQLAELVQLGFREQYAKDGDDKGWVTIGGAPGDGGKKHVGGTPVQFGDGGKIVKGPPALKGKTADDFRLESPKNKEAAPKHRQPELIDKHTPSNDDMPTPRPASIGGIDSPTIQTLDDGRKVGATMLTPGEMAADPSRFQYKVQGIGDDGVTETLKEVKKFRPEFAGQLLAWHDPKDGQTYVINGHHRYELAKRSGYDGALPVYLIDALSEKIARGMGALANIAEGNGTSVDAAKFFRDSGMSMEDVRGEGISMKGEVADEGVALSQLSDSAFSALVNDLLPEKWGLSLARHVSDPKKQDELLKVIRAADQAGKKIRNDQVEEMARTKGLTDSVVETQVDMFGEEKVERSLDLERATVTSHLLRELSSESRAFTEVNRRGRQETLEEAGNKLDSESNARRAQEAQSMHGLFKMESTHKGEVSDVINEFTRELAANPKREKSILKEAAGRLRSLLSKTLGGGKEADAGSLQGNTGSTGSDRTDGEGSKAGLGSDDKWDKRLESLEERRGEKFGLAESLQRMRFSKQLAYRLESLNYSQRRARDGKFASGGDQMAAEFMHTLDRSWDSPKKKSESLAGQQSLFNDHDVRTPKQKKTDEAGRQKQLFSAIQNGDPLFGQLLKSLGGPQQYKAGWNEDDHPRDEQGRFSGDGGTSPATDDYHKTNGSTGGGLGIKREDMPQIKGEDKPEFFKWLTKQGIISSQREMSSSELKPTQADLNSDKVSALAEKIADGNFDVGTPPLVSSDGYVLDGHHRWGAYLEADPEQKFSVRMIGQPIEQLLETVRDFPKSMKVSSGGERSKYKKQWDESKHPRAADGKFGQGGGSATAAPEAPPAEAPAQQPAGADLSQIHRHYPPANPQGKDTQSQFKVGDEYTPERKRLHQQIMGKYMKGVTPSENPTVYMLGGGTASGKSTMVRSGAVKLSDNAVHVDPDEIKGDLPEYTAMIDARDSKAAGFAHEESSEVSKELMSTSLASKMDVVADTTGDSSIEKLREKVASWRQNGHRIQASYATVPIDLAIQRSHQRAEKTGRFVPESVIRGIHANVSKIVPQAIAEGLFDDFQLHDSSSGSGELVASAQGTQLQIHNQQLWDAFLQKGQG